MAHEHVHASPHGHAHHAGHAHDHNRAFRLGIVLNSAFVVLEAACGVWSGSLALLADAGHNLSDVLALALSWTAERLSRRPRTARRTYGLRRTTVLAALINAVVLLIVVGGIAWEALRRLRHPPAVAGGTIMAVAAIGVVINALIAMRFAHGAKRDVNVRAAFLHMAADAVVSAGVILAGLGIWLTGWVWLDAAVSLVIVVVITIGTWGLFRESLDLALDAVPAGIDPEAVRRYLAELPGILEVHDLHIWGLSTSTAALTVHLQRAPMVDDDALLHRIGDDLHERFGIEHPTIQIEHADGCSAQRRG